MTHTILISAGDPSGDMHAAHVCHALRTLSADKKISIAALGGTYLKQESDTFLYDMVSLGGFGFLKPMVLLWKLHHILHRIVIPFLFKKKPRCVVCVDYYGFNIHIASACKQLSIPVLYYVSPQVWASRPGRIENIKRYIKKMIVIFPFEEEIYQRHHVPVSYVGHPLMDRIPVFDPLDSNSKTPWHIGLFPGSRIAEVKRHVPVLLETTRIISNHQSDTRYSLFVTEETESLCRSLVHQHHNVSIVKEKDYAIRRTISFALTTSGTATIENALLGIPMVVVYKTSWFTYTVAKTIIRIPCICMVNVLLKACVVPEYIQHQAQPHLLAEKIIEILTHEDMYNSIKIQLQRVRSMLGSPGVSQRAGRIILTECGIGAA